MGDGADPRTVHWVALPEIEAGSLSMNWNWLSVSRQNYERSVYVFGSVRYWFVRVL